MSTNRAFLIALHTTAGKVPSEIELLPPTGTVGGDGRVMHYNLEAILASFSKPVPIDLEHSTEIKAPYGDPAPAVGWVKSLFANDKGGVSGTVEWTGQGVELIEGRSYRYLSPAVTIDDTGNGIALASAGLTNRPNLPLASLNHEQPNHDEGYCMRQIAMHLGLNPQASEDAILAEIQKRDGEREVASHRAQNPDAAKFVPKADYDTVLHRAKTAEEKLAQNAKAQVDTILDQAIKDGKIAESSREYHSRACQSADGLSAFKGMIGASTPLLPTDKSQQLHQKQVGQQDSWSTDEASIMAAMGLSEGDFKED